MTTIFLIVFMAGDSVKIKAANTVEEVCSIKINHSEAVVFRVDAYHGGRWDVDATMHGVLVECSSRRTK